MFGKLAATARILAVAGPVWLGIAPAPVAADEIADLNDMYESMVALEAHLLDEQRQAQSALADKNAILMRIDDGSIVAVPRATVRDTAGQIYDWAQHWDIQTLLRPVMPPEIQAMMDHELSGIGARIKAADALEAAMTRDQADLRVDLSWRLQEIDRLLTKARTIAANAIAQRDALIRQRDSAGIIDLSLCLDPEVPMDGEAQVATIGYGGGNFPVKGQYICLGPRSFLWDSGATIREYRCTGPHDCSLFSEMAYDTTRREDTGNTVYWLEDQRTHITFFFK
ncbi:hypothetical protein [Thalassovita mangrovi]|uniref:Uncharacterized protein n=1 Tax=Thalassovita mangrovi TaxID=2692236 RepID=A0A6L8LDQ8_9RHOB|nr:hypothetical protein [Thalassovita mangrovi]MYM54078.1 hypothetical protein [Thalassovita mangrovi]